MRSDSQCLHLVSVVNSSASLVMKPFVHHLRGMKGILLFFNRTLKCLRGISKYHHFRLTSVPGVIFVRKPNVDLNYLLTSMPNIFNSGGLSEERKLYLYKHVRPFCSDKFKDLTCPPVN